MTPTPSGDLLRLATWWRDHGFGNEPKVGWIVDPADKNMAATQVNQAVDSGATVIALLSHGHEVAARAVISVRASVTPVHVRDQPSKMSDLEWMTDVAAIRDIRATADPQALDPEIDACAAALASAHKRSTPVVFDGLIAYAGAMATGTFHDSWLPASSSTDPAIQVCLDHWRVRPAVDLRLRGDDDLGLRAVFALIDLVVTEH